MSNYGLRISKTGFDVNTCSEKDMAFMDKYDTFKLCKNLTFSILMPSEIVAAYGSTTNTFNLDHSMGYIPFVRPSCFGSTGGGTNVVLNDYADGMPDMATVPSPFIPIIGEYYDMTTTSNSFTLVVTRSYTPDFTGLPVNYTFNAHTITIYLAVYYNRVDETFDLS